QQQKQQHGLRLYKPAHASACGSHHALGTGMSVGDESEDLGLSSDSDRSAPSLSGGRAEENDTDFREYAKSIGVDIDADTDLIWVVREAFVATLPSFWSEHTDGEGRIYFYHEVSEESSWSHPMDTVFRELIQLIKSLRSDHPKLGIAHS
ncbi:unnamed protein product, partial [Polarella glacialis]